jgi:hypothetical protein
VFRDRYRLAGTRPGRNARALGLAAVFGSGLLCGEVLCPGNDLYRVGLDKRQRVGAHRGVGRGMAAKRTFIRNERYVSGTVYLGLGMATAVTGSKHK